MSNLWKYRLDKKEEILPARILLAIVLTNQNCYLGFSSKTGVR